MSEIENSLAITDIKNDLKKKVTFAEMSSTEKKGVIDTLFPLGVAFWYADPKVDIGDKVFGWGDPDVNGGSFFFGELVSLPASGTPKTANINFKLQY